MRMDALWARLPLGFPQYFNWFYSILFGGWWFVPALIPFLVLAPFFCLQCSKRSAIFSQIAHESCCAVYTVGRSLHSSPMDLGAYGNRGVSTPFLDCFLDLYQLIRFLAGTWHVFLSWILYSQDAEFIFG